MVRILGLDASKDNVCVALLTHESANTEPRQLYNTLKFPRIYASTEGIKAILEMQPDVLVIEPTGVNYTRLWCTRLVEHGAKLFLVGHKELRYFRIFLGLPEKSDEADALALALYYWNYKADPSKFIRERDEVVARLRETALRLNHCARVQNPLINRIRQDLAWQYPEAVKRGLDARSFWRWLAQRGKSAKYDAELKATCGSGMKAETLRMVRILSDVLIAEEQLILQLTDLMSDSRFQPYREVFKRFGFGQRCEAMILSQIYPIENYLKDGRPERSNSPGKKSQGERLSRKPLSQRRFVKALGVAPVREQSGDKEKRVKAGSNLCRQALWQWVFTRIEVKKGRPRKLPQVSWHPDGKKQEVPLISGSLAEYYDWMKENRGAKIARAKTMARTATLLFNDLAKLAK